MKVYFAASIRGGRDMAAFYPAIVDTLKQNGHQVLSGMFAGEIDEHEGTDPEKGSKFIYKRDMDWVRQSDAVVAEVTQPSLGVGYEVAKAEELGKKVICLFWQGSKNTLSAMIDGSPKVKLIRYADENELRNVVAKLLQ